MPKIRPYFIKNISLRMRFSINIFASSKQVLVIISFKNVTSIAPNDSMNQNTAFTLHPQLLADTVFICDLPLCTALLMNEQKFPWVILVPRIPNISELYQLSDAKRTQLDKESMLVAKALMSHFSGEKMNIATLGNVVSQLHIHHVVRKIHDVAWPAPVWGNFKPQPYTKEQSTQHVHALSSLFTASD